MFNGFPAFLDVVRTAFVPPGASRLRIKEPQLPPRRCKGLYCTVLYGIFVSVSVRSGRQTDIEPGSAPKLYSGLPVHCICNFAVKGPLGQGIEGRGMDPFLQPSKEEETTMMVMCRRCLSSCSSQKEDKFTRAVTVYEVNTGLAL